MSCFQTKQELQNIQGQVGSGKADLKLSKNLRHFEVKRCGREKADAQQFVNNAKRARTDLELLDVALDRLQNLSVHFKLAVERQMARERQRKRALYYRSEYDQG